jgi:hypothetical protein
MLGQGQGNSNTSLFFTKYYVNGGKTYIYYDIKSINNNQ